MSLLQALEQGSVPWPSSAASAHCGCNSLFIARESSHMLDWSCSRFSAGSDLVLARCHQFVRRLHER